MAEVFNKGGTDKTVIHSVRQYLVQPFQAPEWIDLRVGWLLSITDATNDDLITGLADTITAIPPFLQSFDRFYIGIIDRGTLSSFGGFTNRGLGREPSPGDSVLASSDIGVGTSTTFFWRPYNPRGPGILQFVDQGVNRGVAGRPGSEIHFVQETAGAGGYATLLALRFTRPNATSQARVITMSTKIATGGGRSGDILFTNTPTRQLLSNNLKAFPNTVQTLGPVELIHVPDSIYLQWPFDSRMRIHAMGLVKMRTS